MKKEGKKKVNDSFNVLDNLQKKRRSRKIRIITVSLILLIIFVSVFLFLYIKYFYSPEKKLNLGAEIESIVLSEDGSKAYVKISGGTNEKEIKDVKFVFRSDGNEYYYETNEGIREINVSFKRGFFDWLTGKSFEGVYNYEIDLKDVQGLKDFNFIDTLDVVFIYEDKGEIVESPVVDTEKPTSAGGGGGSGDSGGSSGGCVPSLGCADYPGQCGIGLSNGCSNSLDCSNNCNNESYCYTGQGITDVCVDNSKTCHDSDELDYFNKGNVTLCYGSGQGGECIPFSFDECLINNITEYYCYYNSTDFEIKNQTYECLEGCLDGECLGTSECVDQGGFICLSDEYCPGNELIVSDSNRCCDVVCEIPSWDFCSECGTGLFNTNCDKTECETIDESCYLRLYPDPPCAPCDQVDCSQYNTQEDCEADICIVGCMWDAINFCIPVLECTDNDLDGYNTTAECGGLENIDCNDIIGQGENIHPNATEVCDNLLDDDCDGLIDEDCVTPCSSDNDCQTNDICWLDGTCQSILCNSNSDCEDFDDCSEDKCVNGYCEFTKLNEEDCYYCADFALCTLNGGILTCGGADINHDGDITVEDLNIFNENTGVICDLNNQFCLYSDINRDGVTTSVDSLNIILTTGCNLEPWRACDLGQGVPEMCDDGFDNDCDGLIDCDDSDECIIDPGSGECVSAQLPSFSFWEGTKSFFKSIIDWITGKVISGK